MSKRNHTPRRSFRVPNDTYNRCKEKAGITPLSRIVLRLLEMWLAGEIKLSTGGD